LGIIVKSTLSSKVLVGVVIPALAAAQLSGTVGGIVTDPANSPIPGVKITVTSEGFERTTVTGADGRYTVTGLPAGHCRIKAELPGFDTVVKEVATGAGARRELSFTLQPACISEFQRVDFGFVPTLRKSTTSVLHIRIVRSHVYDPCPVQPSCVCTSHVATVANVIKSGQPEIASGRLNILQDAGGRVDVSGRGVEPSDYGDNEYVAFVEWNHAADSFATVGGSLYMFPVRDGRVEFRRTDATGLSDGMSVNEFSAATRLLLANR
jgi:hypothetical protein